MSTIDANPTPKVKFKLQQPHALVNTITIPFLFTVAFVFAYPPMRSDGPMPPFNPFWPSLVVLFGIIGWFYMLKSAARLFKERTAANVILGVTVVFWIVAFGVELFFASTAIWLDR